MRMEIAICLLAHSRGCEKILWDEKLNFKDNDECISKWPIVPKGRHKMNPIQSFRFLLQTS